MRLKCIRGSVYSLVLVLSMFNLLGMPVQASTSVKQFYVFACDSTGKVCPNGTIPSALIQSADGNFYGATS